MGIIQDEMDKIRKLHNHHRIRPYPNQNSPSGRPSLIYSIPEAYGMFFSSSICAEIGFHR